MPSTRQLIHNATFMGAFDGGYLYRYQEHLFVVTRGIVIPHEEYLRQQM